MLLVSTNCHYAHIWSGSPEYLSSVHDRYPAIYVAAHIWKCSVDLLSRLVRAAILKSEGVLAVFSRNLKTPIFQELMPRECGRVFSSAYEDIQPLICNF